MVRGSRLREISRRQTQSELVLRYCFGHIAEDGKDVVGLQVGELRDDLVMLIWSGTTGVGPPGKVLDAVGRPVVIASGNLVFALNPWVREQALAGLS